ncbi:GntR family transcriptional regulator [Streptomyces sp. NPDC057740]|uniref:GntR family transcriptional regulator n=1 Tax=Streptomyces sp. NPDC057740 TaxID=3346234 RepID=UPI0036885E88
MRESQTNPVGDLLLHLDRAGDGPLHERVKRALRAAIRDGRIEVGTTLPPSRQLASDLGVSRWEELPGAPVLGVAAGLHLILRLPDGVDTGAVVRAASVRSLRIADLAAYHATEDHADHGLVLGYGNLADGAVGEAVRLLRDAIDACR